MRHKCRRNVGQRAAMRIGDEDIRGRRGVQREQPLFGVRERVERALPGGIGRPQLSPQHHQSRIAMGQGRCYVCGIRAEPGGNRHRARGLRERRAARETRGCDRLGVSLDHRTKSPWLGSGQAGCW